MNISLNYKELSKLVSSVYKKNIIITYKGPSEILVTYKAIGLISLATLAVKLIYIDNNVATFNIYYSNFIVKLALTSFIASSKKFKLNENLLKVYFNKIIPQNFSYIEIYNIIISKHKVDLYIKI